MTFDAADPATFDFKATAMKTVQNMEQPENTALRQQFEKWKEAAVLKESAAAKKDEKRFSDYMVMVNQRIVQLTQDNTNAQTQMTSDAENSQALHMQLQEEKAKNALLVVQLAHVTKLLKQHTPYQHQQQRVDNDPSSMLTKEINVMDGWYETQQVKTSNKNTRITKPRSVRHVRVMQRTTKVAEPPAPKEKSTQSDTSLGFFSVNSFRHDLKKEETKAYHNDEKLAIPSFLDGVSLIKADAFRSAEIYPLVTLTPSPTQPPTQQPDVARTNTNTNALLHEEETAAAASFLGLGLDVDGKH